MTTPNENQFDAPQSENAHQPNGKFKLPYAITTDQHTLDALEKGVRAIAVYNSASSQIAPAIWDNKDLSETGKLAVVNHYLKSNLGNLAEDTKISVYKNESDIERLQSNLSERKVHSFGQDFVTHDEDLDKIKESIRINLKHGPVYMGDLPTPQAEALLSKGNTQLHQDAYYGGAKHLSNLQETFVQSITKNLENNELQANLAVNQGFAPKGEGLLAYAVLTRDNRDNYLSDNVINRVDKAIMESDNELSQLYKHITQNPDIKTPRQAVNAMLDTLTVDKSNNIGLQIDLQKNLPNFDYAKAIEQLKSIEHTTKLEESLGRDLIHKQINDPKPESELAAMVKNIPLINQALQNTFTQAALTGTAPNPNNFEHELKTLKEKQEGVFRVEPAAKFKLDFEISVNGVPLEGARALAIYEPTDTLNKAIFQNKTLSEVSKLAALNATLMEGMEGSSLSVYRTDSDVERLKNHFESKKNFTLSEEKLTQITDKIREGLKNGPVIVADLPSPAHEKELTSRLSLLNSSLDKGMQISMLRVTMDTAIELANKSPKETKENLLNGKGFANDGLVAYIAMTSQNRDAFLSDKQIEHIDAELRKSRSLAGLTYQEITKDPSIQTPRQAVNELLDTVIGKNKVTPKAFEVNLEALKNSLDSMDRSLRLSKSLEDDIIVNHRNTPMSAERLSNIGDEIKFFNQAFHNIAQVHTANEQPKNMLGEIEKRAGSYLADSKKTVFDNMKEMLHSNKPLAAALSTAAQNIKPILEEGLLDKVKNGMETVIKNDGLKDTIKNSASTVFSFIADKLDRSKQDQELEQKKGLNKLNPFN